MVQNDKTLMAKGMHAAVIDKLTELYMELYNHNGFGQMKMEMKFLKRGQKEVILNCGKEYRFVVNYEEKEAASGAAS